MIRTHISKALVTMRGSAWLTAMTVGIVAISFFLLGGFFLVSQNLQHVIHGWAGSVRMDVFLKDEATPADAERIGQSLREETGIQNVMFKGKDDAKKTFLLLFPARADLLEGLDGNPFPASLEVEFTRQHVNPTMLADLADRYAEEPMVEDVVYGRELFDKLSGLLTVTQAASWIVGGLLGLVVIVLVSNTFRLSLYSRRDEVEILLLVGATHGFIRGPFLVEGILEGLLGVTLSIPMLFGVFFIARESVEQALSTILPPGGLIFVDLPTLAGMASLGAFLGMIGSWFAVNSFLGKVGA